MSAIVQIRDQFESALALFRIIVDGTKIDLANVLFLHRFQSLNTSSRANRTKTIEANGVKRAIAVLAICEITVAVHGCAFRLRNLPTYEF
jgi:hypothetical protein